MNIFVYEHVTGGGLADANLDDFASLRNEGDAMIRAFAEDLAAIPDVTVFTLRDHRLDKFPLADVRVDRIRNAAEVERAFAARLNDCDAVMIIAPETGGVLFDWCRRASRCGCRLLSPHAEFVALASDKNATADLLAARAIPVPWGEPASCTAPAADRFPVVLKPSDGCGSDSIRVLDSPSNWPDDVAGARVESWVEGTPVSVAVLCGPDERLALPACRQRLSDDGTLRYLGGSLPLDAESDARMRRLALRALAAFPPTVGYVGVDLMLGRADDGAEDFVIEVNPRLTTSYIGLRQALQQNLAATMLAIGFGVDSR